MRPILLAFLLALFSLCIPSITALKILGISTLPSPSHHIWFMKFIRGLARNGHEIYTLSLLKTDFGEDQIRENQTTSFLFEGYMESFKNSGGFQADDWGKMGPLDAMWSLYDVSNDICKAQIATEGAKQALKLVKNTQIDVFVMDLTIGQCFYGLKEVALGNPSIVGFTPFGSPNWIKHIVGGNNWPALKQYPFYSEIPPFSFWQRTSNFIYHEIDNIVRQYYYMPKQQEIGEEFIGKKLSKSLIEIEKSISSMLVNTWPVLDPSVFLPPNAAEVGALHVTEPKALPQDIQEFLDGAEHGAIIMSLGTNVKTTDLGPERLKAVVKALGKMKQRILWKCDADQLPDKPKNVMIKKWLPQGDALAHPKVRVLWSHSGLLSTQEAVWRGVPLIGMPFFLDQHATINLLIKKGVALRLDLESLTTENILETLNRILNDQSFSMKMKKLSDEYRDRPLSPMDSAVWHVEYAARHSGSPLATPGRDMSRVELNLIDVYAFLGFIVFFIFWSFKIVFKTLIKLFRKERKSKTA